MLGECVNDELDDENRKNLIEENETKINNQDRDDTKVNDKYGYERTDTKSSSSEENNDTQKGEKQSLLKKKESGKVKNNSKIDGDAVDSDEEAEMNQLDNQLMEVMIMLDNLMHPFFQVNFFITSIDLII